jgi:16S rRNA processing protein RimM
MAGDSRDVLLAVVIGAQGLKGEVRVKAFTQTPDAIAHYRSLHDRHGRRFTVTGARATRAGEAVLSIAELADRSAAESLRGVELYVERAALLPTAKDEYYHADLIGLRAEDREGRALGTVQAIHNYGAGDVIEIARADGDSVLLPFTRETVPMIEIDKSRIIVAVPEEVETGERGNVE